MQDSGLGHPPVKPDYGSLGSASDLQSNRPVVPRSSGWRSFLAVIIGVAVALPFVLAGPVRAAWTEIGHFLSLHGKAVSASPAILSRHETESLDKTSAQKQASLLLERAINHYEGAADEIAGRVDSWRGKLKLTPQMNSLVTTGLNSNDLRVRAAAIEVDLAATNTPKTSESFDHLVMQAQAGQKATKIWALWTMGLLANRGVETSRATESLIGYLRDSDPEVRHWAVEGLAYIGSNETIAPLLQTLHDDVSPMVRERAACSLAQSGMLNEQQRRSVIPRLLDFAEDSSLDVQTHAWVFHALRDITAQNLPDDAAAWRNWYSGTNAGN